MSESANETMIADTGPVAQTAPPAPEPQRPCPKTGNPCQTPVYCGRLCWKLTPAVPPPTSSTITTGSAVAPASTRAGDILRGAADVVDGKRNGGMPERVLETIGTYWALYIRNQLRVIGDARQLGIGPAQVSDMMALLKLARAQHGVSVVDSARDMAGYAALAGEVRAAEAEGRAIKPGDEVPA